MVILNPHYFPGITGTESYHTALGVGAWSHDDDDDTLRNQSDQLSIDSFEVRLQQIRVVTHLLHGQKRVK